ncbi:MAG: thiamine pyrophosphate-dependent dehydrogenase E1 component subunit alpha [Acidobacteriota bacterium]
MSTATPSTSDALARELGRDRLVAIWRYLVLNRWIEERLRNLYRQGKIVGGLFRSLGQEGISVGSACALDRSQGDILAPMIRNLGAILVFGAEPREIFAQYMARANSPTGGKDNVVHFGSPERGFIGPISQLATLVSVVAGMGLAGRMQGKKLVTLTYVGDGATSTGDFHEGLNFAAVTRAPFILIVESNGYAYSTPTSRQTALTDLADKAAAYGIPGVIVDGNDVLAVHDATRRAAARARAGEGPTLIEAKTYRMVGHAEHDDASYVPEAFLAEGRERDPLLRYRRLLIDGGHVTEADLAALEPEITRTIDDAVSFAENSPMPAGPEALTGVTAGS